VATHYLEKRDAKASEPEPQYMSKADIDKKIREARKAMEKAAKDLDFMQAAKWRDEIRELQARLE
jgi:excinuclease ABC subunit B